MKKGNNCQKVLSFCLFLLLLPSVFSQTQKGFVKTKGRLGNNGIVITGTRLSGATVTIKGGNAVVSSHDGTFSLVIPNNYYYIQNVQKQGYVLTDPDILARQYAYSKNPLVLVMETPEERWEEKMEIKDKIYNTLKKQHAKSLAEIKSLKDQNRLTQEEYSKKLEELYDKQEKDEKLVSEMADKYSMIDFDEVNEFNRRISHLILEGKLIEADSLINTKGDINRRVETLHQHQEINAKIELEILKRQKKLEKSRAISQKELEDLAQDCYSKFEIFKMQYMNDSAAYYIELRAQQLDSTNIEWLNDAGLYVEEYLADYNKSLLYYEKSLKISKERYGDKNAITADCYANLGSLYYTMDDFNLSIEYNEHAIESIDVLIIFFLQLVTIIWEWCMMLRNSLMRPKNVMRKLFLFFKPLAF